VIYVGNNEDYQVQESEGLTYNYEDKDPESWLKTNFPARFIYEKLLPEVVAEYCPTTFYHPGSPWGDGKKSSDPTVGDMHQWNGKYYLTITCYPFSFLLCLKFLMIGFLSLAWHAGKIPDF
jgi:hypothetical protein